MIGLGPRTVTFININVYVLGLYMRSEDIGELKKLEGWKNFDKSKFLEDDTLAEELLDQPYDISIRLVPARSTNTQHLRDGFLRLFMSRLKDQSLTEDEERDIMGAIQEFKKNFINMKVKKDTEFIFTKTKDGSFNMSYEVSLFSKKPPLRVCILIMVDRARIWVPSKTNGSVKTLLWDI